MTPRILAAALMGAALLAAPAAMAQHSSEASERSSRGDLNMMRQSDAYPGDFHVSGKQSVVVATLQKPEAYRICVNHDGSNVTISTGKIETSLRPGNCTDVEGVNITIQGLEDHSGAEGHYYRLPK